MLLPARTGGAGGEGRSGGIGGEETIIEKGGLE